ncbi:uncharacterized protein LOC131642580 [Vicia villosa]|uniref:uncharacterized protein LOC131642580 n=1 Tax=Vicia villosa TaxID=3911 RepID=UPI00273C4A28|nr:uncharacterized protein LOC131642580 [Vicia villosa]
MWLLKNDRLLTNFSKSRKGLGSVGCKLCGNVCETTIHAIRDCNNCVSVRKSLVPSDIHGDFFKVCLGNWINMNLNYSGNLAENKYYKQAVSLFKTNNKNNSGNKFIVWIPPTSRMIKLNTDGACNTNVAGCGGVLRDHNDIWKGDSPIVQTIKDIKVGTIECVAIFRRIMDINLKVGRIVKEKDL